jgi:hypothetical protein
MHLDHPEIGPGIGQNLDDRIADLSEAAPCCAVLQAFPATGSQLSPAPGSEELQTFGELKV